MKKLYICRDEVAPSPRENDNLTRVVFSDHRFRHLSDDQLPDRYIVYFPLYAYVHGGTRLSIGGGTYPSYAGWDVFLVGRVYVSEPDFDYQAPGVEWARKQAEAEIAEMNWWLAGECWGYRIVEVSVCGQCGAETEEDVESCWGFIGRINECGIKEAVGDGLWKTREMFEHAAPRRDSRVVTLLRCIATNVHTHCIDSALSYIETLTRELGIRKDQVFTWE